MSLWGLSHPGHRAALAEEPVKKRYLLVVNGEDCHPESWKLLDAPEAVIILPSWMGNLVLDSQNWLRDRGLDSWKIPHWPIPPTAQKTILIARFT